MGRLATSKAQSPLQAAGVLELKASSAKTLGAMTASSAGKIAISGDSAKALGVLTQTAQVTLLNNGQAAQTSYPAKKKKKSLGGHYWKPEELATIEPLVTRLPIPSEPEELPPIAPKPRINRLDTFASAHSALAEIGIHYKQSPIDYSSVINALQAEIQQQQDDDMAIATLVAMLI